MFTEIGSSDPTDVHLMTTKITGRKVRGALVDGPVYERIFKSLKGVEITQPDPLAGFQGLAVYHNSLHDYSSNDPTMDCTACAQIRRRTFSPSAGIRCDWSGLMADNRGGWSFSGRGPGGPAAGFRTSCLSARLGKVLRRV